MAQNIFLSEGTIAENIAFGIPVDKINFNQVEKALNLSHLSEFVKSLKDGFHSKVGERGVQLSGIDSAESSIDLKSELWNLLSNEWSLDLVNQTKTINIKDIESEINKILKGNQIGRVVIQHGE